MMAKRNPDLLDVSEAARITGRTIAALYRAAARGWCPAATHGQRLSHGGLRCRLFNRERLLAWDAQQRERRAAHSERRAAVVKLLLAHPERSNTQIADAASVDRRYVWSLRRKLASAS